MKALRILALIAAILAAPCGTLSAADAPTRLDTLLDQLQTTADAAEAQRLERQIWTIWLDYGGADELVPQLMRRGSAALLSRDYAVAEAAFTAVVDRAPDFVEAWDRRAVTRFLRGDCAGAIRDIDRTLALQPRHFGALFGLGLCRAALGDYQAALDAFDRVLAVDPHYAPALSQAERVRKFLAGYPL
ncbi:tetratricopeptide (TPR) repeat protein [Inquilinus ginsengisoli]|uniref:Tetratricopeptide (TPR) repeat protein n=1 Tax=Inquilinus ginsengisoli TaxID=363840 RepID=A0ABU1JSW6_9PROT|nr:tetratricopeptide repeat protein [Inquilinus ginsengisoli]MDR6291721.1 tetratricopeptide (TPR) repeat protein [Inquilinus ginsengisoli]